MLRVTRAVLAPFVRTVLRPGDGVTKPLPGREVEINFRWFAGDRELPRPANGMFRFLMGRQMIMPALESGVAEMTVGEQCILECPSEYVKGERGIPGVLPPRADVRFEVELLHVDGGLDPDNWKF
eukprot:TRINITY_DN13231_c0_g1_i1.p3 TRINITY_DN13231_c0_g1~~TRINITY_DN13231_c0_g1_i1.p3  ORF type:complete len:125 (+),score=30.98 TRINITY_DN13231_c0_g1_i1:58-432(+)